MRNRKSVLSWLVSRWLHNPEPTEGRWSSQSFPFQGAQRPPQTPRSRNSPGTRCRSGHPSSQLFCWQRTDSVECQVSARVFFPCGRVYQSTGCVVEVSQLTTTTTNATTRECSAVVEKLELVCLVHLHRSRSTLTFRTETFSSGKTCEHRESMCYDSVGSFVHSARPLRSSRQPPQSSSRP